MSFYLPSLLRVHLLTQNPPRLCTQYTINKGTWATPAIAGSYNGSNFQVAASV
jgi:hypothetical protein